MLTWTILFFHITLEGCGGAGAYPNRSMTAEAKPVGSELAWLGIGRSGLSGSGFRD